MSATILEHFTSLEDPRIERHKRHALADLVLLTICAVVSGADGWEAIEDFGREKLDWLRQFAPFENGVPSDDSLANVIARLSPKGFQACLLSWTQSVAKVTDGEVIAVDGKTARGSRLARPSAGASALAQGQCLGVYQPPRVEPRGDKREDQ
ncbi:ISAs1 family transposase [Thiocystis minor]|uniref:ISAs1 family transposase n=1 Tax=Thiocystis minor TaxID=61597 RepID=UPI0023EF0814|nr:ISAs1 family transposase [Thiocystis minor]